MGIVSGFNLYEFLGMVLAIFYLILAIRQNILCWYAAFISSAIYLFVFYQANLYMEALLQLFYAMVAIYGWRQWKYNEKNEDKKISTLDYKTHFLLILLILMLTLIVGFYINNFQEELPYLDSFTTIAAIFTTFMVAKKILENWIYWAIIDTISIYIYFQKELYLTTFLFLFYLVLVFIGYRSWKKSWKLQLIK
ncbi:MAG: hypothetical protein CBC38_04380 [Gammaproteobacteria bacterium TMED78]|nr:MAG: hypothetical protein CBC38_04380 [Gammaproteobacteria bacterium TMED78]|tara:strand:- start:72240 stop:72821 length:582 start_codon:yes stop_codon:yes gene_type:complete